MSERKSRRPVDEEHPVIAAMVKALRAVGGPLKLSRIFAVALESGDLPESAHNTIRGRASQHMETVAPVLIKLPKRRGWMRRDARLRKLKVTREWVTDAGAPSPLVDLVGDLNGNPSLERVLKERIDSASVEWLLETLPFDADLAERLREATSTAERREVLKDAG